MWRNPWIAADYRLMLKWSGRLCSSANLTATEARSLYEARREELLSEFAPTFIYYMQLYCT